IGIRDTAAADGSATDVRRTGGTFDRRRRAGAALGSGLGGSDGAEVGASGLPRSKRRPAPGAELEIAGPGCRDASTRGRDLVQDPGRNLAALEHSRRSGPGRTE